MNAREKGLDLIERYIHAVGEELPRAGRDDVKAELRSLLSEQLDERVAAGDPPESAAIGLLQAFGKPDDVAMRYGPANQYLIGPHYYPYFVGFAKITFYFVVGFFLFWTAFGWVTGNMHLPDFLRPRSLASWFVELAKLLALNLGVMVLVFAALERFYAPGETRAERARTAWDPRDLPVLPVAEGKDKDKVSEPGLIAKIYVVVVLAVILNFFPRWFGIVIFSNQGTMTIPYTALGFYLPVFLMNVWWAGSVALNVWLLNLRRWTREARWVELALGLLGAGILYLVITGSSFTPDPNWIAGQESQGPVRVVEAVERGIPWFLRIFPFSLRIILLVTVIETVVRMARILRRYPLF